jgi:hypothetical protein
MSTYQSDPIVSLPFLYISGLNISVASTKIVAISAGQCRDQNNVLDIPVGYSNLQNYVYPATQYNNYLPGLFVNSGLNGANGLDYGTLAASKQYAVYVIASSKGTQPVAGLLSLTSNAYPLLPSGYDSYRLLGFISTNASTNFVQSTNAPQTMKTAIAYGLSPSVSALSAGASTTFAGVDLNTAVPLGTLQNVLVTFAVTFIPSLSSSLAQIRPTGSTATTSLTTITAVAAGVAQTQYITVIAGVNGSSHTSVDYLVSSASDSLTLSVVGYVGAPTQAYPS